MKVKIPKNFNSTRFTAFQLAKILAWKNVYIPEDLRKEYKIKGIVNKDGDLTIKFKKR